MTVEELIWELQMMPHDAAVVDWHGDAVNHVAYFIDRDSNGVVGVEHRD